MKTNSPRTWLGAVFVILATVLFVTVTQWLLASPSEDIKKAVASSGNADVKKASASDFLDAFAAVLIQNDEAKTSSYVRAAQQMRPDLKDQIATTATDIDTESDDANNGEARHVSQHRRRCTICHNHHTLHLPCVAARHHLQHHPGDTRGPCTPTPTPSPH